VIVISFPQWLAWLAGSAILLLVLLTALHARGSGHSALYSLAARIQRGLWVIAAVLPTCARLIDGFGDGVRAAWQMERPRGAIDERAEERTRSRKVVGLAGD